MGAGGNEKRTDAGMSRRDSSTTAVGLNRAVLVSVCSARRGEEASRETELEIVAGNSAHLASLTIIETRCWRDACGAFCDGDAQRV